MAAGQRELARAVYRALRRCALRVQRCEDVPHLRRNAVDIVVRSSALSFTDDDDAAADDERKPSVEVSRLCVESGPAAAVRRAFDDQVDVDLGLSVMPAAHRLTAFAEALDGRKNYFAPGDDERCEGARIEAAAFRVATALGATPESVAAARRELDERGAALREALKTSSTSPYDVLRALDEANCFVDPRRSKGETNDAVHRLDAFLLGQARPQMPIVAVVAAICVARRAALPAGSLFGVGAPRRFLLGLRGLGTGQSDDWFVQGDDRRELVTLQPATSLDGDVSLEARDPSNDALRWRVFSSELTSAEAEIRRGGRWLPATLLVVSEDEVALVPTEGLGPPLHFRRANPKNDRSVLFVDCLHAHGRVFTRSQLTNALKGADTDERRRREPPLVRRQAEEEPPSFPRRPPPVATTTKQATPSATTLVVTPPGEEHDELRAPLPEVDALEIARRICRNVHAAALVRRDALDAMLAKHAELDCRV